MYFCKVSQQFLAEVVAATLLLHACVVVGMEDLGNIHLKIDDVNCTS